LRNYCIHEAVPDFASVSTWDESKGYYQYISLDKEKLLLSDRWTKESLLFINEQDKQIILKPIFLQYANIESAFFSWYLTEYNNICSEDFKYVEECQRKMLNRK
jgi:hypothetical protein